MSLRALNLTDDWGQHHRRGAYSLGSGDIVLFSPAVARIEVAVACHPGVGYQYIPEDGIMRLVVVNYVPSREERYGRKVRAVAQRLCAVGVHSAVGGQL